jgi:hypothetical protein
MTNRLGRMACVMLLSGLLAACGDDAVGSDAGLDAGFIAQDSSVPEAKDSSVPVTKDSSVAMMEDAGDDDDSSVTGSTLTPTEQGLCTGDYAKSKLVAKDEVRGTWQYNPGGPYVDIPESGYPCAAFKYDGDVRPKLDDPSWTEATDGQFIGFSETSTIAASGYTQIQFRYFRSLVYVPTDAAFTSLTVEATGIDDSLHVVLFNSEHPDGFSPTDVAPTDATVGACQGNGSATWDFINHIKKGEVNVFMLVHADQSPSTSQLTSVDIKVDGASVTTFDCTGIE